MFFGQLEKHFPGNEVYVFTDDGVGIPDSYHVVLYNSRDNFRTQYLSCLKSVGEDYLLYMNEDYILYDDVRTGTINDYLSILSSDPDIACIRFTRGDNFTGAAYKDRNDLFYLDNRSENFFSQTAALWRKSILEKIHETGPDLHIAGKRTKRQFEVEANKICSALGLQGLIAYNGEPKRGIVHYDSVIFPYIATALVKGRWNLGEYEKELLPLLAMYRIDYRKRGQV